MLYSNYCGLFMLELEQKVLSLIDSNVEYNERLLWR